MMSADNGIYILRTPTKGGDGFEYRVAHAQAIENLNYAGVVGDWYTVVYFGNSEVHTGENSAFVAAAKEYEAHGWTEYGICSIKRDEEFPDIPYEKAKSLLYAFWKGYADGQRDREAREGADDVHDM